MAYDEGLAERVRMEMEQYPGCIEKRRPMKGWIVVTPEGYESSDDLRSWVEKGVRFAQSLPVK